MIVSISVRAIADVRFKLAMPSQSAPSSPKSPTKSLPPLTDELRTLFDRGEHESVVLRAEQLAKRKRSDTPLTRLTLDAARAFSLIHLGRSAEAVPLLDALAQHPEAHRFEHALIYAKRYVTWSTGEGLNEAIEGLEEEEQDRKLKAQLSYRGGDYDKAVQLYEAMLKKVRAELEERRKPVSRWRLASVTGRREAPPLTAAELQHYNSVQNELATNCIAALVLDGKPNRVADIAKGLANSYELQYNKACASIAAGDFAGAEVALERAEALILADLDEEEDDLEELLAPVRVQKAYLMHLSGDIAGAQNAYGGIMADRKADAASLAVAANNLTVTLGQLAFGGGAVVEGGILPKNQHDALVEGLKKMRATSGKNVERKLALNQRRAMARNRAILSVQMGRYDTCRAELTKLKSEFSRDPLVPLIEASMVAKQGNLETADKILEAAGNSGVVRAGRVQLAAVNGNNRKAAKLLGELFPGRHAAVVTAASLLEDSGDVGGALKLLKELVAGCNGADVVAANKILAGVLLRNEKYEEAAEVLRQVCKADVTDSVAQAQLVVATSYFDANEAEQGAMLLPISTATQRDIDVEHLESLPPPKRRDITARQSSNMANGALAEEKDEAATVAAARERKKRKRKKRLPKNYDPEGPPPDPERWLPKTLRSGYKKKKAKDQNSFRGSQGADAAAAEAAAAKNAERSAARATERETNVAMGGRGPKAAQRRRKPRK